MAWIRRAAIGNQVLLSEWVVRVGVLATWVSAARGMSERPADVVGPTAGRGERPANLTEPTAGMGEGPAGVGGSPVGMGGGPVGVGELVVEVSVYFDTVDARLTCGGKSPVQVRRSGGTGSS